MMNMLIYSNSFYNFVIITKCKYFLKYFQKHTGCFGFIREFFDFALVTETFRVAFQKGTGNRRLRVCLLLIVVCVVFGPLQGKFYYQLF